MTLLISNDDDIDSWHHDMMHIRWCLMHLLLASHWYQITTCNNEMKNYFLSATLHLLNSVLFRSVEIDLEISRFVDDPNEMRIKRGKERKIIFFKIRWMKKKTREIDPIDGKIANVVSSEMALSCLFCRLPPLLGNSTRRWNEDRYTSASSPKSQTTSSPEYFFSFLDTKLKMSFSSIITISEGWLGGSWLYGKLLHGARQSGNIFFFVRHKNSALKLRNSKLSFWSCEGLLASISRRLTLRSNISVFSHCCAFTQDVLCSQQGALALSKQLKEWSKSFNWKPS